MNTTTYNMENDFKYINSLFIEKNIFGLINEKYSIEKILNNYHNSKITIFSKLEKEKIYQNIEENEKILIYIEFKIAELYDILNDGKL